MLSLHVSPDRFGYTRALISDTVLISIFNLEHNLFRCVTGRLDDAYREIFYRVDRGADKCNAVLESI